MFAKRLLPKIHRIEIHIVHNFSTGGKYGIMGVPGKKVRSALDRYGSGFEGIVAANASFPQVIPGGESQALLVDKWG